MKAFLILIVLFSFTQAFATVIDVAEETVDAESYFIDETLNSTAAESDLQVVAIAN